MTQTSAFHFESLVWDWPIAIYLFLIGISAGLVTLAVLLRRFYPQAGGADSTLLRTTLIVGPGAVILGLLILVFHLTRPWTFWKLMFHYSFTSVMSMGVMLFQLYMVVLVLWLAKIFEHDLLALQQRWLPKLGIVQKVLSLLTPVHRGLETLMLVLAVLLGAYTGFLLSALKSYPFLNNPILPVLFLFSGISSGAAVALIAMAIRQRSNPHSTEAQFVHRMEIPVVWGEIFLLVAFFVGLALGDDGKVRALVAALGGGFWTWWFWLGVAGLGLIVPMLLKPWVNRSSGIPVPGIDNIKYPLKLGQGPGLMLFDKRYFPNQKLVAALKSCAAHNDLPLQFSTMKTGATDGGRYNVMGGGRPVVALCLPTRYLHANSGMISKADYDALLTLIRDFLTTLTAEKVNAFSQFRQVD